MRGGSVAEDLGQDFPRCTFGPRHQMKIQELANNSGETESRHPQGEGIRFTASSAPPATTSNQARDVVALCRRKVSGSFGVGELGGTFLP